MYKVDKASLRKRIGWKLLPPSRHRALAIDLPQWAADALVVENHVRLGLADRLRVLLAGRLEVRSQTFTEYAPGRVESWSSTSTA